MKVDVDVFLEFQLYIHTTFSLRKLHFCVHFLSCCVFVLLMTAFFFFWFKYDSQVDFF